MSDFMDMWSISKAATQGNVEALKSAAEKGIDLRHAGHQQRTPLRFAVEGGQAAAVQFLLSQGAGWEAGNPGILEFAVQGGHADIVELLWPHCNAEQEFRSLECAISLGFHEISDFLIEVGGAAFQKPDPTSDSSRSHTVCTFAERDIAAFQHWERLLFARRGQQQPSLHPVFLDYALLLASKADHNAGLPLVEYLLGEEAMADVNCQVMIERQVETPLTAAAEKGNLDILAILIDHPQTDVNLCGKYQWPAFLHFLASPVSISTESGRVVARQLYYQAPPGFFPGEFQADRLEDALMKVFQYGDDSLVKQVIDLFGGAASVGIIPLLIRTNEADGLRWVVNNTVAHPIAIRPWPSAGHWILLCQYLEAHPNQNALKLLIDVAQFLVQKKIWIPAVRKCLEARNFSFIQQFFFYPLHQVYPDEVIEATLAGLATASTDISLMTEWADEGFSSGVLWDAMHTGIWKENPAFQTLVLHPSVDINGPDIHRGERKRPEPLEIPHAFFPSGPYAIERGRERLLGRPRPEPHPGNTQSMNPAQQTYTTQLRMLEHTNYQQRSRRRDTKCALSWAIASRNVPLVDVLLLSPNLDINAPDDYGRTPLMYAIAMDDRSIIEKLLNRNAIDLNRLDVEGQTAIFYAVEGGDLDIVRLLVATGKVDFSIRDREDQGVRDFAETKGDPEIIAALSP